MTSEKPSMLKEESSSYEISLLEIYHLLKDHIILILVSTFLFTAAAGAYSYFLIKPTYSSSATVFIQPKVYNDTVNYTELMTNERLVNTYTQIAKSNAVIDLVYPTFRVDELTKEGIVGALKVASIKDTEIIKFTAVTTDPEVSARLVNKVVSVFITKISSIMELNNLSVIDQAISNPSKVGPSNALNALIGALIGFMLAIGFVFLRFFLSNTLKSREEIENYLDIPVLGEIYFNE
ncbi:MAG: Wzz/FepE/Etk N-terminal domain-containing protein [Erysipelotrichaceae bacterium]